MIYVNENRRSFAKLGTTVAAASVFSICVAMSQPEPAQAFGWSDITGTAKKVGGKVKSAAKTAGNGFKGLAKGAAKGAGKVAKEAGALGYEAGKGVITTVPKAGVAALTDMVVRPGLRMQQQVHRRLPGRDKAEIDKAYDEAIVEMHDTFRKGGEYLDRGVDYVEDKVKNNTGRGVLISRNPRRENVGSINTHANKRQKVRSVRRSTYKPGEWGGNRPNTSKLPPARRDESKMPPPRKQRPRPITADDIKPPFCNSKFENCSKPFKLPCNSKFENCSGVYKNKHKGKKYNGRDRSTWGRPLGAKKTNVIRKSLNKRVQAKVLSSRNSKKRGHERPICYGTKCQSTWLPTRKDPGKLTKRSAKKRSMTKKYSNSKFSSRFNKRKIKRPVSVTIKKRMKRKNARRVERKTRQVYNRRSNNKRR